jgi:gluconate 2-dehydrogenase alpha chain
LFGKAARELGYKPFPQPSGNLSQAYTNPLGLKMAPCTYCGFCEWFGCSNYAKASPQTTILPFLVRKPNFSARDNSEVIRITLDKSGTRATGVTFVDPSGEEWEQAAELVVLSAYWLFNVQLLLHSRIGRLRPCFKYRHRRAELYASDDFERSTVSLTTRNSTSIH